MKTKTCTKCKKEKTLNQFGKDKKTKDKLNYWCRECNKKYRNKNKEKITEYRKEHKEERKKWYREHREEIKEYNKKHNEKRSKYMRMWYQKHKIKILKKRKKYFHDYRQTHKKEIIKYRKEYYQKHKKDILLKRKHYKRDRLKTDLNFKITQYLRTRIWWALKENSKSKHTIKLVGCSIEFLKKYLKSKFKKGMNWSNYGKWHIDHIRPCASFDLSKAEEQRKCFNYKNLQPLWAEDNLKKHTQYNRSNN
jgi:hypothetical protein